MTINNLLEELNPAQRKAATTDAQNTLVLAGAVFVNIVVTQFKIKRLKPHWH